MHPTDHVLSQHFRGTLTDVSHAATDAAPIPDTLDLTSMARAGLNYLRGNPEPTRGYECKFSLGPLGIPCHCPRREHLSPYAYDPISLGDTDSRMDWQYAHLREMAGEPDADRVERGVRARVLSYLGDDHCSWVNPAAYVGHSVPGVYIGTWTTAKLLYSLSETWEREGDEQARTTARQVFEALRGLAQWDGDRAWYMGIAPYRDGKWLMEGWCEYHGRNYPFIVEPCVRYWETTGDEEALDLARAFTEGFLAEVQPDMGAQRIDAETGAFEGHVHAHTHAIWGVAHLGVVLGERRYLDWVQQAYEFVLANGTDYGWYPEHIPQQTHHAEICVVGDMVSIGAWLARGLSPHYWDHVERTVRNELRRAQFFLTDPFVTLFRELHRDRPVAVVEEALCELRRLEGGFVSKTVFDDWVSYPDNPALGTHGMANNGIHMMGCCPPEGLRGLWEAWNGVVEERPSGVFVNLAIGRENPAARVTPCRPADGRYDVLARKASAFYLRPPAWADREGVSLTRNGQAAGVTWAGPGDAYVLADACDKGDLLTLCWPVLQFAQSHVSTSVPGREEPLTVRWCGNEVTGVEPRGTYLPMF